MVETGEDRKRGWLTRLAILVLTVGGIGMALAGSAGVARGATGDQLRQITGATPPCSVGTGLAFDGTHLILSCWGSNKLWRVSPADGSLMDTLTIAGASDLRAMAWDSSQNKLWACNGGSAVVLIDTTAQTSAPAFTSSGCVDGLAFDGSDGTIWASGDSASSVQHFKTDGTALGSFSVSGKLGNCGNSGIAVGGDKLYLANDGCSEIYQCTKDLVTCTLMSSFPKRIEDLECDNVTFAPKGAIWSIDAYDRILNAWEIPAGTCSFGGGNGGPPPPSGSPAPPKPVATPCIPGIVESRCFDTVPVVKVTPTSVPPTAVPTVAPPKPTAVSTVLGAVATPRTGTVIAAPNTGTGHATGGGPLSWALLAAGLLATGGAGALALARRRR
ncbi:MAG TPA: hypothetical protein VEZ14_00985 [Dehalococcoidia bacterium]|nr:hypothetical protein [Dehalococcoidia bacterium]